MVRTVPCSVLLVAMLAGVDLHFSQAWAEEPPSMLLFYSGKEATAATVSRPC
jgi:hypothetical protein